MTDTQLDQIDKLIYGIQTNVPVLRRMVEKVTPTVTRIFFTWNDAMFELDLLNLHNKIAARRDLISQCQIMKNNIVVYTAPAQSMVTSILSGVWLSTEKKPSKTAKKGSKRPREDDTPPKHPQVCASALVVTFKDLTLSGLYKINQNLLQLVHTIDATLSSSALPHTGALTKYLTGTNDCVFLNYKWSDDAIFSINLELLITTLFNNPKLPHDDFKGCLFVQLGEEDGNLPALVIRLANPFFSTNVEPSAPPLVETAAVGESGSPSKKAKFLVVD